MKVCHISPLAMCRSIWIAVVMMGTTGGCSSSVHMERTWRDPSVTGPLEFKKTVALSLQPDGDARRAAEDEMVKQIGPERAVAGYTIVTDEDRKSLDQMKSKLAASGVDVAMTMKVTGSHKQTNFYETPGGHPGLYEANGGFQPGETVSDTVVNIQTNVYSVADGKLVWSGTTESVDSSKTRQAVADVTKAVVEELRHEKLMQ